MEGPLSPEPEWPELSLVAITLCDACLDGEGGECHTPGCALWVKAAPDVSIRDCVIMLAPGVVVA